MLRRGHFTLFGIGIAAVFGAMMLIPGGEPRVAVAEVPDIASTPSQETLATIDAMLRPPLPEPAMPTRAQRSVAAPDPDNFEAAALKTPDVTTPATDLEGAPLVDPNLKPDAIGRSAVNLRAGPSSATATVTVLQPGQAVSTGESDGGWVEVTLPDGTTGWVFSRYLASVEATAPPPQPEAAKPKVDDTTTATIKGDTSGGLEGRTARIASSLDVRTIPSKSARTIFRTEPGERVKIVDSRGNWIRIVTADGSSGWIQAS